MKVRGEGADYRKVRGRMGDAGGGPQAVLLGRVARITESIFLSGFPASQNRS